jgi:hypothetical protein
MKSCLHRIIPFFAIILKLPIPKTRLNSIPLLPSSYPGRLVSRDSTQFFSAELFFITSLHGPRRKQPLYCWEGVLTAPLHSNGSNSIIACVFVAAGMCLPSRCLAMNVYSDCTIPTFGLHVIILFCVSTVLFTFPSYPAMNMLIEISID